MNGQKVSFAWLTRRDGNDGYVLEQSSRGHIREFGPMPCHIVPAFVQGRRRIVARLAAEEGLSLSLETPEDYTYLTPPEPPPRKKGPMQ
jgi:hypothetical protein